MAPGGALQSDCHLGAMPFEAVIAHLDEGDQLTQLYGYPNEGGLGWVEAVDSDGRIDWVPRYYTSVITLTPTQTPTPTPTPTGPLPTGGA